MVGLSGMITVRYGNREQGENAASEAAQGAVAPGLVGIAVQRKVVDNVVDLRSQWRAPSGAQRQADGRQCQARARAGCPAGTA